MIWQHFYRTFLELDETLDLSNGILIHGGGWKKLVAVSPEESCQRLEAVCGISTNYGMVEQTGCIYMECPCGHLV